MIQLLQQIEQEAERINGLMLTDPHFKGGTWLDGVTFALSLPRWIKIEEGCEMPEIYPVGETNKGTKSVWVICGKSQKKGIYFPDRFKTVEFEDWDDYIPEGYQYMIEDKEKGCVWLKAGWYEELYNSTDDYYYWSPISPTHWQPLPAPPTP